MRVATAVFLFALAATGCDSSSPEPPPFVVQATFDGETVEEVGAALSDAFSRTVTSEVRLAPFRDAPSDPALAERYRLNQRIAAVLSAATDDSYSAGYYLVRSETAGGAIALGPASCATREGCLPLVNDGRFDGEEGAVFFPVRGPAQTGPSVPLRPFGVGGAGRLVFEGADGEQTVDAPDIGPPSVVLARAGAVRVVRGTSDAAAVIAVRRGGTARTRVLGAGDPSLEVEVPGGEGPVEVVLLRVE